MARRPSRYGNGLPHPRVIPLIGQLVKPQDEASHVYRPQIACIIGGKIEDSGQVSCHLRGFFISLILAQIVDFLAEGKGKKPSILLLLVDQIEVTVPHIERPISPERYRVRTPPIR